MKLLLDTHILLWYAKGTLPVSASAYIFDESNELFFSPASIWEVVTKNSLGRKDFQVNPFQLYNGLIENDCKEMAVTSAHTLGVAALPTIHKDPFDRILLAQAIAEGASLLTSDSLLANYPGSVIFVR